MHGKVLESLKITDAYPGYNHGRCMVAPHNVLIWFCIPKNATQSLIASLSKSRQWVERSLFAQPGLHMVPRFVIWRHPVARCLSSYLMLLRMMSDLRIKHPHWHKPSYRFESFEQKEDHVGRFVAYLEDLEKDGFFNIHTAPQWYFITSFHNKPIKFNYVLQMDSDFPEVWQAFQEQYFPSALPSVLPRGNAMPEQQAAIRSVLKEEIVKNKGLRNRIDSLYRRDCAIWNEPSKLLRDDGQIFTSK